MPLTKVASSMLASGASGSGGSTGKNYISSYNNGTCNGDFESGSISGWSVFSVSSITNGLPSGAPTTISAGGSNPDITLVSPGSQLAGQYSLQASFPISTSANKGFISNIFTIDSEDKAKVLAFKFYYQLTSAAANVNFSGTSSNTFLVSVYAVDGTNIGWLQPAGVYSMTQTSGAGIATGTFQTYSDTTQYRFAVICLNNPTSTAATVTFDDFSVSPEQYVYGTPVTDWVSYTPTFVPDTGSITNATSAARWRRVGDNLEVNGAITFSNVSATFSACSVSIPSGLTIDSTKQISFRVGHGSAVNAGIAYYPLAITSKNSTSVYIFIGATSGSYLEDNNVTNLNPFTFSNADTINFNFSVPISGWSSSVQTSDTTDTRICSASYYQAVNTGQNATCLDFPTKDYDTHSAVTTGSGTWKFTAPLPGYYSVELYYSGQASIGLTLLKDGVAFTKNELFNSLSTGTNNGSITTYLNAGQYIQIYAAGSTAVMNARVTITRITGPSAIAASETIAAAYYLSANQSTSTTVRINFDTKIFDTHGAVTVGSSWVFTAPISGRYEFSTYTYATTTAYSLLAYKGASSYVIFASGTSGQPAAGTTIIELIAGETVHFRPNTAATMVGGLLTVDSAKVYIKRIGN